MSKDSKIPPTGIFSRSKELISLAASIGAKELGGRFTDVLGDSPIKKLSLQLDQARVVMESLGRLKGAAMKVGQLLSMEARDFFPPEVTEVLSQLQSQAPPVEYESIEKILLAELGEQRLNELEQVSRLPIAAASIGQVHKARWRGQDIVVKIQYPGIAESIPSDLQILKSLTSVLLPLARKNIDTDALFAELESVLIQETDYLQEAIFLKSYKDVVVYLNAMYTSECGATPFSVPDVLEDISSKKVLAMTFEEGLHVDDFLRTYPTQELRNIYGQMILDLYIAEFFKFGRVQTDPNFSNFIFKPAPVLRQSRLIVVDFGATRLFTDDFIQKYRSLFFSILSGDQKAAFEKSVDMKFLSSQESPECQEAFWEMLRQSAEPFSEHRQPFEFGDVDYVSRARKVALKFTGLIRYSPPPHELIFLHRKLGGVFQLLKTLEAKIDLRPYLSKI